jgi:hypothetical protein
VAEEFRWIACMIYVRTSRRALNLRSVRTCWLVFYEGRRILGRDINSVGWEAQSSAAKDRGEGGTKA